MQNHYSLIYREDEREMVPTLKVRLSAYYHFPVHDECPKNSISASALSRGPLWAVVF
jgi:hypothetical protein